MATLEAKTPGVSQDNAATNVKVTIEAQPPSSGLGTMSTKNAQSNMMSGISNMMPSSAKEEKTSESKDDSMTMKEILSSLAETRKYLPNQVNTFLDSFQGKSMDEIRSEAMHLANKAQEEAKKRTADALAPIDNARHKVQDAAETARTKVQDAADNARTRVQDVADMAAQRTQDLANKGKDLVQAPIKATTQKTSEIANKGIENTKSLANRTMDMAIPYLTMAQERLTPVVAPYAKKAKEYLPPTAKSFLEENVEGKPLSEISSNALKATRKSLLSVDETALENKPPSVIGVTRELATATTSGALFKNALDLSEKAVSNTFGPIQTRPNTGVIQRLYNITMGVGNGVYGYTQQQINQARKQAWDMTMNRMNQTKDMGIQRASQLQKFASPYVDYILNTRIPFIGRVLGGKTESTTSSAKGGSGAISSGGVGTSAGLNMGLAEGMKPGSKTSTIEQTTKTQQPQGAKVTVEVKGMPTDVTKGTEKTSDVSQGLSYASAATAGINNTNAQGLGNLGSAGMGVTTTGGEQSESVKTETEISGSSSKIGQSMAGGVPVGQHKHGKPQQKG